MDLQRAQKIADGIIEKLKPYCLRRDDGYVYIEIAGSVRRKRPFPRDIDLVLIPSDPWNLNYEIASLGQVPVKGGKIQRINHDGVQVDLYFAEPKTWATLLLIRTGSAQNNIRLASLAKRKGWHLKASGDGLFDENGQRIAGETEESIFEALGIPYQRPEARG